MTKIGFSALIILILVGVVQTLRNFKNATIRFYDRVFDNMDKGINKIHSSIRDGVNTTKRWIKIAYNDGPKTTAKWYKSFLHNFTAFFTDRWAKFHATIDRSLAELDPPRAPPGNQTKLV